MAEPFDPKHRVEITRAVKRGEWYTVEGVAGGKKTSVDIPAPTVESRSRRDAEALMRRSILGTALNDKS